MFQLWRSKRVRLRRYGRNGSRGQYFVCSGNKSWQARGLGGAMTRGEIHLRVGASSRLRVYAKPGDLKDPCASQARETPPLRTPLHPGAGGSPLYFIPVVVCRTRGVVCVRRHPGALVKNLKREQTCRKCGNDEPRSTTIVILYLHTCKLVSWSPGRLFINGG